MVELPALERLVALWKALMQSLDTDAVRAANRRLSRMPGNDVAQAHRYLDLGARLDEGKVDGDEPGARAATQDRAGEGV